MLRSVYFLFLNVDIANELPRCFPSNIFAGRQLQQDVG